MTIVKLGIRGEGWGCRRERSYSSRSAVKDHKSTLGMNVASKRRKEWRCVQLRWRGIFHPGLASSNNPSRLRLSLRAVAPFPKSTPWVRRLRRLRCNVSCVKSWWWVLLVFPPARATCLFQAAATCCKASALRNCAQKTLQNVTRKLNLVVRQVARVRGKLGNINL